ncbi:putative hydrolase (plasmid) [Selenomonas ruminantium subsp. lactilytica TAM6421]|uniref:Putative hydrolase n=1 Tax=Selenomonas ruminantium subsp. lactilytica (strain NBRC 103574 / TAM6421) TaxID=927704 RepID=I0GUW0_SELRL|nr:alpha/beta hydrolase [Selenomonas ruminantium]BAL84547.1 putative hydrolase [Selenomonas ruminantium subsp. lactilytica TAM6421]
MRAVRITIICLVLNFLCLSAAWAGEILQENIPLERNGIQLHLERYAEQDGQEKKPILFVHGVTYSSHEFDVDYGDYSLTRYLARHGFEVWLLDIAGFGRSGEVRNGFLPDSDYAAEDIAAAVRCILARHNLPSMDILGWSWGTVTSGRFAAKYPELVHRLVLYAPIVAGLGDVRVKEPFHKNTWEHAADDFQKTADGSIDFNITEKAVADTYLANAWHYDKDTSPNGGRRDLLVSSKKRLIPTAEIKAPVLIIAGTNDPYVTPEMCAEAYKTLPNKDSRLEIIPGAAHAMLMERPYYKLFRENVMDFLVEGRNE